MQMPGARAGVVIAEEEDAAEGPVVLKSGWEEFWVTAF